MADKELRFPPPWDLETKRAERALKGEGGGWAETTRVLNGLVSYTTVMDVFKRGRWRVNNWLIEDFLRKESVVILAGEAGTGKTYLAFDVIFSIISGCPWLSRFKCDQGPAYYHGAEGDADALVRRLIGIGIGRQFDEDSFSKVMDDCLSWTVPGADSKTPPVCLNSPEWRNAFLYYMRERDEAFRPVLFVFDPLLGLVQNVDTDPALAVEVMKWGLELAKVCNACVLFLHHTNKREESSRRNRIRGESAWTNLATAAYVLERTDDPEVVKLYDSKQRDDECLGDSAPKFGILKSFRPILEPKGLAAGSEPGVIKEVRFAFLDRSTFEEPDEPTEGEPDEVVTPASVSKPEVSDEDIVAAVLAAVKQKGTCARWGIYNHLKGLGMGIGTPRQNALLRKMLKDGLLVQAPGLRGGTAYALPDSDE
jgi:hypothetical protein